jgi:hypothetical protein
MDEMNFQIRKTYGCGCSAITREWFLDEPSVTRADHPCALHFDYPHLGPLSAYDKTQPKPRLQQFPSEIKP